MEAAQDTHLEKASDDALRDLRVPPHSVEAEQAVLAGLMLDENAYEKVADRIVEGDFYRKRHQVIYGALQQLAEQNETADVNSFRGA